MDCVWLIRQPLDETGASDFPTLTRLWNQAQSFEAAASGNGDCGPFSQFPTTVQLPADKALLMIGGRESLGKDLSELAQQGPLVQLQGGSGIGLFVSRGRQSVKTALSHAIRFRSDHDPGRYTLVQLFHCAGENTRQDQVSFFGANSVTFRRIYTILANSEILRA